MTPGQEFELEQMARALLEAGRAEKDIVDILSQHGVNRFRAKDMVRHAKEYDKDAPPTVPATVPADYGDIILGFVLIVVSLACIVAVWALNIHTSLARWLAGVLFVGMVIVVKGYLTKDR